jgi:hypothetical protein
MNLGSQWIDFSTQPPSFILLHHTCNIELQLKKKWKDVKVIVRLLYEDSHDVFSEALEYFDNEENPLTDCHSGLTILEGTSLKIKCHFKVPSDGRRFVFEVAAVDNVVIVNRESREQVILSPIYSSPFSLVEYTFKVETHLAEPCIFFKDKGGKDAGISLTVFLYKIIKDPITNQIKEELVDTVNNEIVKVRPCLIYENGSMVIDQTILKSINEAENFIISNGSTKLKFRINQVSSKHLNQKFCIQMQQFLRSGSSHPNSRFFVAPGRSAPIDVRSKQNLKPNQSHQQSVENVANDDNEGSESARPNKRNKRDISQITVAPPAATPSASMTTSNSLSTSSGGMSLILYNSKQSN